MTPLDNGADLSTAELVKRLAQDASHLVQTEAKLARSEVKENIHALVPPVILVMTGALLGVGALLAFLLGVIFWLAPEVGGGLAGLIVAAVAAAAAAIFVLSGTRKLGRLSIAPSRAQASIERDVAAIKGNG